jgi:hypothetical protein
MNRSRIGIIFAASLSMLTLAGGILTMYGRWLATNDESVPSLPIPIVKYIAEARIERHEDTVASCDDNECFRVSVPLLRRARRLLLSAGIQSIPPISEPAETAIAKRLSILMADCDRMSRPQSSDECWGQKVFGVELAQLGTLSPKISDDATRLLNELQRLTEIDRERERLESERKRAEERERARVEAEKAERERKKREYEKNFMEFTWTDTETGELSGKAIIERARIRKYRSIGNNDMAQVFVKMFDGWGNAVTNPSTGQEFYELRINCDIYETTPDVIVWGNRRYGMGGNMPRNLCAEAGYPRR